MISATSNFQTCYVQQEQLILTDVNLAKSSWRILKKKRWNPSNINIQIGTGMYTKHLSYGKNKLKDFLDHLNNMHLNIHLAKEEKEMENSLSWHTSEENNDRTISSCSI